MLITLHPVPHARRGDDVMRRTLGASTSVSSFARPVDVTANNDGILLVCDVPGTSKEDLDITVENRTLTLKGIRRFESDHGEQVMLGRSYGAFTRIFALSDDVDVDGLQAELADGVLSIRIPSRPQAAPKKIAIATPVAQPQTEGQEP